MAKNILQDIVPPEKRSIRNIPVPSRAKKSKPKKEEVVFAEEPSEPPIETYDLPPRANGQKRSRKLLWTSIITAVALFAFGISTLMARATVKIFPKQDKITITNESFTAKTGTDTVLPFEIVKISKEGRKAVPANGEEKAEVKASGHIVIFNEYDAIAQRLIKNTRFETPEGLIYRINESVVVPGRTVNGDKIIPGSVEVTVYADEPGEKYNIGLTDFTIPGFKNDPKYTKFYGRSKTQMTGGFIGMVKKVTENDLKTAQVEIRAALEAELLNEIGAQIPETSVLYHDASIIKYEPLPQSDARGNSVSINERGTLHAVVLKKADLSRAIAARLDPDFAQNDVEAIGLENLAFQINDKAKFQPERDTSVSFTLNGETNLVMLYDEARLRGDLAGKPKRDLGAVLVNYPPIEKAEAVVRPFWKRSFPKNSKSINLIRVLEATAN